MKELDIAEIVELREQGKSWKEISKAVGRAPITCYKKWVEVTGHKPRTQGKTVYGQRRYRLMLRVFRSNNGDKDTAEMARLRTWMDSKPEQFMNKLVSLEEALTVKESREKADVKAEVIEKDEGSDRCVAIVVDWMKKLQVRG
jgi:hypothetical protein